MEGDNISTEDSPGSDPLPVMFRDRDLTWPMLEYMQCKKHGMVDPGRVRFPFQTSLGSKTAATRQGLTMQIGSIVCRR